MTSDLGVVLESPGLKSTRGISVYGSLIIIWKLSFEFLISKDIKKLENDPVSTEDKSIRKSISGAAPQKSQSTQKQFVNVLEDYKFLNRKLHLVGKMVPMMIIKCVLDTILLTCSVSAEFVLRKKVTGASLFAITECTSCRRFHPDSFSLSVTSIFSVLF